MQTYSFAIFLFHDFLFIDKMLIILYPIIKNMQRGLIIMEYMKYIIIAAGVVIFLLIINMRNKREQKERLRRKIKARWGALNESEMSYEEYDAIANYYRKVKGDKETVDDITWNDLDMDRVFILANNTFSSIGQEMLYKIMRMPEYDNDTLIERDRIIEYFKSNPDEAQRLQEIYATIGKNPKISFIESINNLCKLENRSNIKHHIMNAMYLVGLAILFVHAGYGVLIILGTMIYALFSYFSEKAQIEPYFICIKHIISMNNAAKTIAKADISAIKTYNDTLLADSKKLAVFLSRSQMIESGTALKGSLMDVAMDYVRMSTHIDLIQFNAIASKAKKYYNEIMEVYELLGYIEAMIAAASFRELLPQYCKPELTVTKEKYIEAKELYHPLISEPVANSINENKCVLLTGSNASGKSTFLKTVAINAILSQTLYTSVSESYKAPFYRVYSSMSLSDDIMNNESYYMAEIKALKRIIDADSKKSDIPVLAFVDEVLRGTNTIERIAASTEILLNLSKKNVFCFAATHDIELTHLLESVYSNYHFQEEIRDDDILFNYRLYKGRAESRNAIKLLGIIGYSKEIIDSALKRAGDFEKEGVWSI